jgi:hypothetical protein
MRSTARAESSYSILLAKDLERKITAIRGQNGIEIPPVESGSLRQEKS